MSPLAPLILALGLAAPAADDWYEFRPTDDPGPTAIGMEDWSDGPAGQAGRITRDGDRLVYDGKPIKLWGLNLCYGNTFPERALADRRARFYARLGINSVRLHKFADGPGWAGIQSAASCVAFDPEALDRLDYQVAKLKEAGLFLTLSAHFGTLKLGPDDRKLVPYLDEFGAFQGREPRVTAPHSALFYSPELQDVQIRQMVNLLRHRNPHTGLTYAEDPAIAFIEAVNEQSILFFTTMGPLKQSPTLRRRTAERFSDWLRAKYGDAETLAAAWGPGALDCFASEGFPRGESLEARTILPLGNPWYWDPDQLAGSQAPRKRRLLDTARFLYELQAGFYARYAQALRAAGYAGEVLGSNWQAGRGVSHYYNLHSDALVGTIDRHNYFGGGRGQGPFNNASMLRLAGSATLSSGLQQVRDRPFMLSEWIHVWPNEYGVEGPALVAAYGLGLQGWDASYLFQNGDNGGFSDRIGRDQWDATAPQVLGLFPAVARQVRRGDVAESDVAATLRVHLPALDRGEVGFADRTAQSADLKGFDSDRVPARALAVARCSVEFTDAESPTPAFDLAPFMRDGALVSSTGQLRWFEGDAKHSGYFTIDTPGTKAVVGFARDRVATLGDVTIAPRTPFGAVYVTARGKADTIATADRLIVVALARARNTDMRLNEAEDQVLDRGRAPIRLEPVAADVTLVGRRIRAVRVLDHDGRRTDRTLPVRDGRFTLEGARDRTPYYEVELE